MQLLIIEPETNMEDARRMLYMHKRIPTTLHEIARASPIHDATAFFEGNNRQINEASRLVQTHRFEDKLVQMLEEYPGCQKHCVRENIV
jgi:hypothetical protein